MPVLTSKLTTAIMALLLIYSFFYSSLGYAKCNTQFEKKKSSCTSYNIRSLVNTNNPEIALANKNTLCLFQNECFIHQLCYDDTEGSKESCDKEFISDIKYQCKVNFGFLVVVKKVTKRTRTCLKSTNKTCRNLKRNCGQTCLVYGPEKINVTEIEKTINKPYKSDYLLPGAIFYPKAGYQACLAVAQGYKVAASKMKAPN